MKGNRYFYLACLSALFALGAAATPALADDTKIFFAAKENTAAPNVLFILDTSKSMEADVEGTGSKSRMRVLQESLNSVLAQPYEALNVGIMDFNSNRSGGIDFPITDINADAHTVDNDIPTGVKVGAILSHIADSYTPNGWTPMADALYIASNYFLGANIVNTGSEGIPNTWDNTLQAYTDGHPYADNPAAYEGVVAYTTTQETGERNCSRPGDPEPAYRICSGNFFDCSTRTGTVRPRPAQYRTRTYTCDSSGFECGWDAPNWNDGIANCSERPPNPQPGDTWVECRDAVAASSYSYEQCKENYTYDQQTWGPTPTYKTPIKYQCQSNYVVLLTDGEPTRQSKIPYIASLASPIIGSSHSTDCADLSAFGENVATYGRCLPELAEYMRTVDQIPNTELDGDQTVTTYTIGFKLGGNADAQRFLKLLADKGQGDYFDAGSPKELVDVFQSILKDVTANGQSFVAPSVNIDPNNKLATSEFVYRATFDPSDNPGWNGDILKEKIDDTSPTGFTTLLSLAGTLVAGERHIYTNTDADRDVDLSAGKNHFDKDNAQLNKALLALPEDWTAADRNQLIDWARGIDVKDEDGDEDTTEQRHHLGDPLHSKPALVTYADRDVIYAITNDGFLHAFDVSTDEPKELFAFIPRDLLPNLKTLYTNLNTDSKVYGLDGGMAIWQAEGHTYLYLGMRRGGRNYYALDISDPDDPRLMWTIKGGVDEDFGELGQSWSTPLLTQVKHNDNETMALIFGGGYDPDQDRNATRADDDQGRAIYVVDATTGELLWSAGKGGSYDPGFRNSIPSALRAIDLNGNGLADRLYFGDTGGRIWRIDLAETDIDHSSGYQLAELADNTEAGNRRFYYAPSVAFGNDGKLRVAIGSGYRADPLDVDIQDRFYVFEDINAAFGLPTKDHGILLSNDLTDVTNELSPDKLDKGWRIDLAKGEKVLAESLIFNNKVVFTSYTPQATNKGDILCNLSSTAKAYILNLGDGRPARSDLNADDAITRDDRWVLLGGVEGIPGSPYIVFNKPDTGDGKPDDDEPPTGRDEQTADLYVDSDHIDTDNLLTERVYWDILQ